MPRLITALTISAIKRLKEKNKQQNKQKRTFQFHGKNNTQI